MENTLEITKISGSDIYYRCVCGAVGKCMIRPVDDSPTLVVNVVCAICGQSDMITLAQDGIEKTSVSDISWAYIISNEIL